MSRVVETIEDGSLLVLFDGWSDKFNMVSASHFRKYRLILPGLSHSDLNPKATPDMVTLLRGSGCLLSLNNYRLKRSF